MERAHEIGLAKMKIKEKNRKWTKTCSDKKENEKPKQMPHIGRT